MHYSTNSKTFIFHLLKLTHKLNLFSRSDNSTTMDFNTG